MRFLVTGGAGFIGSHLVEELSKLGEVVVVDDLSTGTLENLEGIKCSFIEADITSRYVEQFFCGVDYVFHQACAKCVLSRDNPLPDLMINAYGTHNVIQSSINQGVKKVIHASTGSVNNYKPKSFYGVSKTAAELYYQVMKEYYPQFRYTLLRYYHVYGPRQSTVGVIPKFIDNVIHGKPIEVFGGKQVRHFTWVKDVVAANLACMDQADNETIDVVNAQNMTIKDLAHYIRFLMDKMDYPIEYQPWKPGEIKTFSIDNTRAMELGVDFRTINEGLKETVRWYVSR